VASPYGHALVGLGLFNLWWPVKNYSHKRAIVLYGLVVLGALTPDLDFLPGILLGSPGRFHHGLFHSLGMALLLSSLAGTIIFLFWRNLSFLKTWGFVLTLIFSHLLLDFFTEDLKSPFGFPLFWPFSGTYFISPWQFLPHVERDFSNPSIWGQIIWVFLVENLLFLPLCLLAWRLQAGLKRRSDFSNKP
jgi:inner membrane protein